MLAKRVFDLFLVIPLLVALSPLMLLVAFGVWMVLGRPIFFRQLRPGKDGRPFIMFKFRTMSDARGKNGELFSDARRLGRFGAFLRRASLDELPELFNVLKGDMSLVGPRPLLMEYLHLYTPEQARRHVIPPGITGLAQIKGRNALSWEEKFRLDVWYVDNWSLGLDLRILARTVWAVISGAGVSQEGHATTERFRGSGG